MIKGGLSMRKLMPKLQTVAGLFVTVSLCAMSVAYSATGLPLADGGCSICIP